jgi:methylase of polypeptide subunit release factors
MQNYSLESPVTKILTSMLSVVNGELFKYQDIEIENNNNVFSPEFTNCSIFFAKNLKAKDNSNCIEMGVGSAFNLIYLSKKYNNLNLFGCDINSTAVELSKKNLDRNGVTNYSIFKSNLFEGVPNILFDFIYFNPPLIFQQPDTILQKSIFDKNGETITEFIKQCKKFIHPKSKIYILYTTKNKHFIETIINENEMTFKIIAKNNVSYETYNVYEVRNKFCI